MNQNPTIHATHSCAAPVASGITFPESGTQQPAPGNATPDVRTQQPMSGNLIPDAGIV